RGAPPERGGPDARAAEGERLSKAAEGTRRRAEASRLQPDPRQRPAEGEVRDLQALEATAFQLVTDHPGREQGPAHACGDEALDGLGAVHLERASGGPAAAGGGGPDSGGGCRRPPA